MESETGPKEPKAANMPAPEVTPVDVAASSAEAMSSSAAEDTSEKQDILYFPLRYTRIRNYWGFPELAFDDINNDPQEVQVEYCESDPKVYDYFIRCTFIKPIVALYEPISRTLVRRENIMEIKDMKLPNGRDTIWSVVYKGPEKQMSFWDNLAWTSKLMLKDEFSPMLYIEDLEKGRYKDTLYDVLWWYWKDKIFQQRDGEPKQAPQAEGQQNSAV
ncbi:hypothetical protein AOL_s00078g428 [Orbilia oligospora ATCC 24927]|uniref:Uncharacterized protein n=1 Tax=Arthrobotrys oligospora (strain ATCC 24927 / CBS 115.81 / DSM 1491) TaxID=756982 RepID=G1XBY1_ARTOA|nr:hypothetical protein AOL_s00078g428 [Orbilia oligospora ATCC 24927]EGX49395.1 hypothetical protein AOL_s00078g428 [Orbilia oligospora ATCC 24927]